MSVADQKSSVAAGVEVPLAGDGCNMFSGRDSDMNVQATEMALDSESQATGIASLDESHSMSRSR